MINGKRRKIIEPIAKTKFFRVFYVKLAICLVPEIARLKEMPNKKTR